MTFLVALALLGCCVALVPPLRSGFTGTVMLFTQKSVHTLAGALRAQNGWVGPYSVLLALFRAALLPWLPPLLPLANAMVLGNTGGYLLSLAGGVVSGSGCFWLSRLLLRPAVRRWEPPALDAYLRRWGGVLCCSALLLFPGAGGIAGYLLGVTGVSFRRYLAGVTVGEAVVLLATLLCASPYQTQLPDSVRILLALTGVTILLLCLPLMCRNQKKRGNDVEY